MFKKLRNKFILNTMIISTAILVMSFGMIFGIAVAMTDRDFGDMPPEFMGSQELRNAFVREINGDRSENLASLGWTLVIIWISTEFLVFVASYFWAESAIRPVRDAYEKQRIFIANASHELKTPIAAIQANFEALGATEEPWVSNIDSELTRASSLVSDLLMLARTDGRGEATKTECDVVKTIKNRFRIAEARFDGKKVEFMGAKSVKATLCETDLSQIVDILLDNAAKYSKKWVHINICDKSIAVANDGKKIPADKLEKVFDRFYQVDKTSNGTGLGLAIAKALAEQNHWDLIARSDEKMTEFELKFAK